MWYEGHVAHSDKNVGDRLLFQQSSPVASFVTLQNPNSASLPSNVCLFVLIMCDNNIKDW